MQISNLGQISTYTGRTVPPGPASRPAAEGGFGPAAIRSAAPGIPQTGLYGPSGALQGDIMHTVQQDARTGGALERRDAQVRQTEQAQGEAVGGNEFIYQTGPDGELYAIGTRPHLVKKEEEGSNSGQPGATAPEDSADTPENRELLQKLQMRDAHVKAHESAHVMAAGGQAGPVTYTYQKGPDGRSYAIGGSVNISVSSSGDPEESARQAERARRAATANGEMSAADAQTARRAGEISEKARAAALEKYAAMQQQ